jgi:hypothetical protein
LKLVARPGWHKLKWSESYSIFGITVDRIHALKWFFPQEKATFHGVQKVYAYSENALVVEAQEVVPIQA